MELLERYSSIVDYALKGNRPYVYAAVSEHRNEREDIFFKAQISRRLRELRRNAAASISALRVGGLVPMGMLERVPWEEAMDILAEHDEVDKYTGREQWLRRTNHDAWQVLIPALEAAGALPLVQLVPEPPELWLG